MNENESDRGGSDRYRSGLIMKLLFSVNFCERSLYTCEARGFSLNGVVYWKDC